MVRTLWGADIKAGPVLLHSHGSEAKRRFGAGGARAEVAAGFPSLHRMGCRPWRRQGARRRAMQPGASKLASR